MFVLQKDARQMICIVSNKQTFPPPTLPVESVPLADSGLLMMMIRYDVKTCQFGVIGSSLTHNSIQREKRRQQRMMEMMGKAIDDVILHIGFQRIPHWCTPNIAVQLVLGHWFGT